MTLVYNPRELPSMISGQNSVQNVHSELLDTVTNTEQLLLDEKTKCIQKQVPVTNISHNVPDNGAHVEPERVQNQGHVPLVQPRDNSTQSELIESMTKLLQAQTEMMAAQAQPVTVQTLPPPTPFTGEESRSEDDTLEWWLERFEEWLI